jgi:hypothetical protein
MDDDSFLVNPDSDALYQLNGTGTAVWHLLAQPMTIEDIAGRITAAFPEVGPEIVLADVRNAMGELEGRGLVLPCS